MAKMDGTREHYRLSGVYQTQQDKCCMWNTDFKRLGEVGVETEGNWKTKTKAQFYGKNKPFTA